MADDAQYVSRFDNKRKFDDPSPAPPGRRPTGFSAPIAPPAPSAAAAAATPVDGIELAKQRAQEIALRLFNTAEAKRPKHENGGDGADDSSDRGFSSAPSDYLQKPSSQTFPSQGGMSVPTYGYQGSTKRIDIPNGRVGVIIGKGGETIKYLQLQSGAKIQVTRDSDADFNSQTRPVEIVGTSEQISRAEQLINDVLAEADAGASSGRKMGGTQSGTEQFVMKVPNNKVGLVIGKGGETIKSMQAKSGARIQLIPLHPPPDYALPDRTVQIDGTKEQIEIAKQLVNEVTSENRVRNPQMTGGYNQQGYRPSRPTTSWGPPGAPPVQQPGYGYMQPGAYPGPPPAYTQPPYGGYPPAPASGGYTGWEQSPNPANQQTTQGYDYYNQQQPPQQPPSAGSSLPADNTSHNYGQQPGDYNSQGSYGNTTYAQSTGGQQGYGQDSYSGGYNAPAQAGYPNSGYDQQQGYNTTAPSNGAVTNPAQDGSATTYTAQSNPTQASSAQPVTAAVQSPATQQGYGAQQPPSTVTSYPSQGTAQAGYGVPPTSQAAYGSQPQTGYGLPAPPTQSSYGQSPQKPSPRAVYGQIQQSPSAQSGYVGQAGYAQGQQPPAQSGYGQDPSQHRAQHTSGFAPGTQVGYGQQQSYDGAPGTQVGYGQQQSYDGAPPQTQSAYGQQQQQTYGESYNSSGYSQPSA